MENLPIVSPHAVLFEEQIYISSAESATIIYYNPFTHAFKDLELATPLPPALSKTLVTDGTSLFIITSAETRQVDSCGKAIGVHAGYNPPGAF